MAANIASLVNQQLYHAQLLLSMIDEQDEQAMHYRAAKQALLNAAVQAVFLAYQGFLAETAVSCQLKDTYGSVQALDAALALEGRSHAIVSNLKALLSEGSSFAIQESWLQRLLSAESSLLQAAPSKLNTSNQPQMLIQASQSGVDSDDVLAMLESLKQFIDTQRDYLQEW